MAKNKYRIALEQLRVTGADYTIQAVLLADTPLTRKQVIAQVVKWGYAPEGKSSVALIVTANLHGLAKAGRITRTRGDDDDVFGWPA